MMRSCEKHMDEAAKIWGKRMKSFGVVVVESGPECPFCDLEEGAGPHVVDVPDPDFLDAPPED